MMNGEFTILRLTLKSYCNYYIQREDLHLLDREQYGTNIFLWGWIRCFSEKKGSTTLLADNIRKWLYIYLEEAFNL